jgi:uncharacterized protein (TIGR03643 family)
MQNLSENDIDRVMQMAWEDRTTFEAIFTQFGLTEREVVSLMRTQMKRSSFEMWRKRMKGRATKHQKLRENEVNRFKCTLQKTITSNKISKR